eukprot:TRINITY_DN804_c0_g2_i1.p1 TRINITY_DN804_c0_g2~~TRINITY_DN804_c0_g2_i1.p1  ORF type:complete len:135 (+),score=35.80 TRINITY_DN804_c0_g2_i1:270-674(+)
MVDANPKPKAVVDPVWSSMLADAAEWAKKESALASWMHASVLDQRSFEDALAYLISQKIGGTEMSDLSVYQVVHNAICLLYTSDAADDLLCVDLGGRRIIKKKKRTNSHTRCLSREFLTLCTCLLTDFRVTRQP